jgi:hypothetical protein
MRKQEWLNLEDTLAYFPQFDLGYVEFLADQGYVQSSNTDDGTTLILIDDMSEIDRLYRNEQQYPYLSAWERWKSGYPIL